MMRISAVILGSLSLITCRLGAQQPVAGVSNAVASPVLPDIVAFERNRGELRFVRLSTQREFPVTRAPMTERPVDYAGQLDWRPVGEQGRSWFAYVATDDKDGFALMLNYIDDAGQLSTADAIRIPFAGRVNTPRWSRDGMHLAFVSDSSILYIVSNVAGALRSGYAADLRPTRVSSASSPALSPAWSPSGDNIAYGTEVVSGAVRNRAIEVLPINPTTGEAAGVPVVVTGELSEDDEYRPSWSRDGKYLAFFAHKTGADSVFQPASIGIVEVVLNPRTGKPYRGIVKEGGQRWLADDVIADDIHGPAWTSFTEAGQRSDAVLFVQRDASRNGRIVGADVLRWLAQLPRGEYETVVSSATDAVGPRSASSVEMNKRMRFVFTAVKDGSESVSYRDIAATWAQGPEGTPVVVAAPAVAAAVAAVVPPAPAPKADEAIEIRSHRGQDVARAMLFPGLGQFSAGRRAAGSVLAVAGVAGAVVGVIGTSGMSAPLAAGKAAVDAITRDPSSLPGQTASYNQAKSDFEAQRSMALLGAGVFAASWLYGIVDASTGRASGGNVALKVTPDRSSSTGTGANIGLSIAVGHLSRGW